MKVVKQAIVLVDSYRKWDLWNRNTKGRYQVGACTEKEAVEYVRKKIGFGSVQFYYWETKPRYICKRGEIKVENYDAELTKKNGFASFSYSEPHHACEPQKRRKK